MDGDLYPTHPATAVQLPLGHGRRDGPRLTDAHARAIFEDILAQIGYMSAEDDEDPNLPDYLPPAPRLHRPNTAESEYLEIVNELPTYPPVSKPNGVYSHEAKIAIIQLGLNPILEGALHVLNGDLPNAELAIEKYANLDISRPAEFHLLRAIIARIYGEYTESCAWYRLSFSANLMYHAWPWLSDDRDAGPEGLISLVRHLEAEMKKRSGDRNYQWLDDTRKIFNYEWRVLLSFCEIKYYHYPITEHRRMLAQIDQAQRAHDLKRTQNSPMQMNASHTAQMQSNTQDPTQGPMQDPMQVIPIQDPVQMTPMHMPTNTPQMALESLPPTPGPHPQTPPVPAISYLQLHRMAMEAQYYEMHRQQSIFQRYDPMRVSDYPQLYQFPVEMQQQACIPTHQLHPLELQQIQCMPTEQYFDGQPQPDQARMQQPFVQTQSPFTQMQNHSPIGIISDPAMGVQDASADMMQLPMVIYEMYTPKLEPTKMEQSGTGEVNLIEIPEMPSIG